MYQILAPSVELLQGEEAGTLLGRASACSTG